MKASAISAAITAAVQFLVDGQESDGGFSSWSSPRPDNFERGRQRQTTFFAAQVLSSLSDVSQPAADRVKRRAAGFLQAQRSPQWSFNYWAANSTDRQAQPYPDDLDDTFCALAALAGYQPALVGPTGLAAAVKLLSAAEVEPGGPYRTWLMPPEAADWQDVDLAVNSNVGYFLALHDVALPNLERLVETAIAGRDLGSRYYPTIYPVTYFITRFYRGGQAKALASLIKARRRHGHWGSPLKTALAVSALANLGELDQAEATVTYLLANQYDGGWPAEAFCLDPATSGRTYYAGAASLTTAFVVEALHKLQLATKGAAVPIATDPKQAAMHQAVVTTVRSRFMQLPPDLRRQVLGALDEVLRQSNQAEIVLLPYLFWQALGRPRRLPADMFVRLGAASLYGWLAYTIYDDFLDEEGEPPTLSAANVALRELTLIFHQILPRRFGFAPMAQQILDGIDAANTWEVTHCRPAVEAGRLRLVAVPRYGDLSALAERSLGHALGPLAVMFRLGFNEVSPEVRQTVLFFRHYLIARQLNDDAHDWETDLRRGHINAVGALLLRSAGPAAADRPLDELVVRLQEQLWTQDIVRVCRLINRHVRAARSALAANSAIVRPDVLQATLEPLERSARQALAKRAQTIRFMQAYTDEA